MCNEHVVSRIDINDHTITKITTAFLMQGFTFAKRQKKKKNVNAKQKRNHFFNNFCACGNPEP